MFGLLRLMTRSGGVLAVTLALAGFAFYGIALLSVMIVDDPGRGLRVLAVFSALSTVFCLLVRLTVHRAIAQAMRPVDAAREAAARIATMGGDGGRRVFSFLGGRASGAGGWAVRAADAAFRAVRGVGGRLVFIRFRRSPRLPAPQADVIPLRREDRKAR